MSGQSFAADEEPVTPSVVDRALKQALQENQALKEQIEVQAQLMQLLTHQLGTPLTALNGSLCLLGDPDLETIHRQEFVALVQQQVVQMKALLKDLMALRDLETGAFRAHPIALCVKQLLLELGATVSSHSVRYQFAETVPEVWCDRWQVSQVLVNLLSNAVKYSPNGGEIELGVRWCQETNDAEVWVRDWGLGIPKADQSRLCERFFRVNHRDRATIAGTGLGLSLCKLLVEHQGGQMGFESVHGEGSRFYFTLPIAPLQD